MLNWLLLWQMELPLLADVIASILWQISGNSISHCGNNISHKKLSDIPSVTIITSKWIYSTNVTITSVTKALMAIYHMAITSAKHSGKQQLTIASVKPQSKLTKSVNITTVDLPSVNNTKKIGNKFKNII